MSAVCAAVFVVAQLLCRHDSCVLDVTVIFDLMCTSTVSAGLPTLPAACTTVFVVAEPYP